MNVQMNRWQTHTNGKNKGPHIQRLHTECSEQATPCNQQGVAAKGLEVGARKDSSHTGVLGKQEKPEKTF